MKHGIKPRLMSARMQSAYGAACHQPTNGANGNGGAGGNGGNATGGDSGASPVSRSVRPEYHISQLPL